MWSAIDFSQNPHNRHRERETQRERERWEAEGKQNKMSYNLKTHNKKKSNANWSFNLQLIFSLNLREKREREREERQWEKGERRGWVTIWNILSEKNQIANWTICDWVFFWERREKEEGGELKIWNTQ